LPTLSLLVKTARYYQSEQSIFAMGAEGSKYSECPANVGFTPESGHQNHPDSGFAPKRHSRQRPRHSKRFGNLLRGKVTT